MKILWVKSDFLHPTTRGGQIRTLETLRRLHTRHEVHYIGFVNPGEPQGLERSREYCSRAYPIAHSVPPRYSASFAIQLVRGVWQPEPVSISRYRSREMRQTIDNLIGHETFDAIVCDFLTPAINISCLERAVLFQHNVESVIWERHADNAVNPIARAYLRRQAKRMRRFEQRVCKAVRHIIAVSESDAETMKQRFAVAHVSAVPTGVDIKFFGPPPETAFVADLVFVGSMDWLPNIDGIQYFVREVLPLIRRSKPDCSLAIVGRRPPPEIRAIAVRDPNICVTGTVDDVRPYLWGSSVSIVPLRIGGGTRLKIFEAMAARIPVVSTPTGAEGLNVTSPAEIRLADSPGGFAEQCIALLNSPSDRVRTASAAWQTVSSRFSWDRVVTDFETALSEKTEN